MKRFSIVLSATAFLAVASVSSFASPFQNVQHRHSSTRLASKPQAPQLWAHNQPLVNSTILIDKFTLDKTGWVMSHLQGKNGQPGTMAGVTGPFAPGTYRNVRIKLNGLIKAGDKVWPMLHYDSGSQKGVFEPTRDHHVEVNGKVVTRQITITAIKGTPPKAGALMTMPPRDMMSDMPMSGMTMNHSRPNKAAASR